MTTSGAIHRKADGPQVYQPADNGTAAKRSVSPAAPSRPNIYLAPIPGELRNVLKLLVDRRVRENLKRVVPIERPCPGCSGDQDEWTVGCTSCSSRHKKRRHRAALRCLPAPTVVKVHRCRVCGCRRLDKKADCETCRQSQEIALNGTPQVNHLVRGAQS